MIKDILKNKLKSIGYFGETIDKHIDEVNFGLLVNGDNLKEEDIEVTVYGTPDVNIERAFLNIDSKYLGMTIFDGVVEVKTVQLPTTGKMTVMDYPLDKRMCLVLITSDMKMEIILYSPENDVMMRYIGQTYNSVYSKDREEIIQDYLDEFISSNRLMQNKAREVMDMLAIDFVIDEMVISNVIPVLKLYNTPENFAEKITNYEFKYINRRINRIEVAEKSVLLKRASKNVKVGFLSNDPYVKLNEANNYADFYLNSVSYFWLFSNEKGQEEIGIYTAPREERILYSNYINIKGDALNSKVREISAQFTNQLGFPVNEEAIKEILLKLNHQLVIPPVDIILKYAENPSDPIEPLSYRYKALLDPTEFESRLYNSIEDNMGRRYKYKLTENVLEDLTTIGNKLDYTTSDGKTVKKQSIADFNQNGSAVIIRRETLIDESNIPDLLGYIYDDVEGHGTSNLPVPSIEVDFYYPSNGFSQDGVKMYNGTNYEDMAGNILSGNNFNSIDDVQKIFTGGPAVEGSTKVIVRYIARNGDILRENKIGNVFPGDTYVPEILPIISDKEGKEWTCKATAIPRLVLSSKEEENVIELQYIEKIGEVKLAFINTEGKELLDSQTVKMQIGSEIDKNSYLTVVDKEGIEWELVNTRPAKPTVSEDDSKNFISFVYDVTRVDVTINYINRNGNKLKSSTTVKAVANKKYTASIDAILIDDTDKYWVYISEAAASMVPLEKTENVINLVYDEMKAKVTTTFEDENGNKLVDDVVEFIQVGKEYSPNYERKVLDMSNRAWNFSSISTSILKVNTDEKDNVIKVIYSPVYSSVTIKAVNGEGKNITRDWSEKIQVGSLYTANNVEKVKDVTGRIWKCVDNKSIEIVEEAEKNVITLLYDPLFVNVTARYIDDENRDIISPKVFSLQAGDSFKPERINRLEDKEGRRWQIIEPEQKEYTVNEQEEDNKISIYYEKVLTSVLLSFKDLYGNKLLDDVKVDWQIGAEFTSSAYEKIKDNNGARWSRVSSEPKTMIVKEQHNSFILIYDEIRTKVILRYINIDDNTAIKEPDMITAKLGITYMPNIQREFIDPDRLSWTYVGEKELSIVTQEEEQDNVLVLKYEPHNAKVTVRYLDENGKSIIADNTKDMQVGREVQIKKLEKIYSEDKLGYSLKNISNAIIRVNEDETKNVVDCEYVPLLGKVITVFRNEDDVDLIKPKQNEIQVGLPFNVEIIDKVIDESGKYWNYSGEEISEIGVVEEEQTVCLRYEPELKKVKIRYINKENEEVLPTVTEMVQVGENYIPKYENSVNDIDGKVWDFTSLDKKEIIVSENEEDNVITIKHEQRLVDIIISFINDSGEQIRANENMKVQLGSVLKYEAAENITDRDGVGWEIEKKDNEFKITEDNNKFIISYIPYLVNVYDRFVSGDNDEIIDPVISRRQVGTKYEPEIKEMIVDNEGREWQHVEENRIFGKGNSIVISVNENDNNAIIKYSPSLTEVSIVYVDPLGTNIKPNSIVKAQIGSEFSADVIERITDSKGNKWTYNPNTKNQIKVEKEGNTIILSYEEQKAIVIYKYQDEFGNRLTTPRKTLAQVGMNFKPEIDSIIEDDLGRVWEYKERDVESIEIKDTEQDNVFIMIYAPLKVDVVLIVKDNIGNEIISPIVQKAQLGSQYKPVIDTNITDENSLLYKYSKVEPETIKVKETPIGSTENINVFNLTYEPVYSAVTVRYQDIDGNIIREDEKQQLQVGSIFTPKKLQYIKDRKENQWQLLTTEDISLRVKESIKENTIKFVYEIAKADVIIRYRDTEGNSIQDDEKFNIQIGNEFIPNAPKYLFGKDNRKWSFFSSEPVKLKVGSINNIVTISYQEEKATVIVKYKDENGRQLKQDDRVLVQIGSVFIPKITSKVIYDENEIWRFARFEPNEIVVSENTSENVITQVYTNNEGGEVKEVIEQESVELDSTEQNVNDVKNEISDVAVRSISNESGPAEEKTGYVYQNAKLSALDKFILLNDDEKMAIEEISALNNNMVKELNQISSSSELSNSAEEVFNKEKKIINDNFASIIESDKTGSKLLKIFEVSLAPTESDRIFDTLQQRKAIAMTEYFLNKPLTDGDHALYICSKGKNDKQIEVLKEMKAGSADINEVLLQVLYEKLLLENYYRARSTVKDNYFVDESSRNQIPEEVSVIVSNMIVNQTYNLIVKDKVSLYQQVELKALGKLLNQLQKENLKQKINKISDGKVKKNALKKLQTI